MDDDDGADDEADEEDGVDPFLEVTLPPPSLLLSALSTSWAISFTENNEGISNTVFSSKNSAPF